MSEIPSLLTLSTREFVRGIVASDPNKAQEDLQSIPPALYDGIVDSEKVLGVKIIVTAKRLHHRQGEHILVRECFAPGSVNGDSNDFGDSVSVDSRDFDVADNYEVVDEAVVTFGDDGNAVLDYCPPLPDGRSGRHFGCTMEVTVTLRGTVSRFLIPLQRKNYGKGIHYDYPCFGYKESDVSDEKSRMPAPLYGNCYVAGVSITVDCSGRFFTSMANTTIPMYRAIEGEDYNMFKLHRKDSSEAPFLFRVDSIGKLSHEEMLLRVIKSLLEDKRYSIIEDKKYSIKRVFTVLNDQTLQRTEDELKNMLDELNRLNNTNITVDEAATFDVEGRIVDLTLGNKGLKSLPESFGYFKVKRDVDLGYNQLETLPESFGELQIGRDLNLIVNKLVSLPSSFGNLTKGRKGALGGKLMLRDNKLESLPHSFGNLSVKRHLYLDGNNLESLPDSFGNIDVWGTITLYDNCLTQQSLRLLQSMGNRHGDFLVGIQRPNCKEKYNKKQPTGKRKAVWIEDDDNGETSQ